MIEDYLKNVKKEFELYLEKLFPIEATPKPFEEIIKYALTGGGKRIRAILAITVGRILNGKDENIFPIACAVEFIHCYSLIHDDLPAMDNDEYRRGKLTVHKKFGEAMGILAGDALLTHAFWLIASKTDDKSIVGPLIEMLSWYAGLGGMVSGQVADIMAQEDNHPETILGKEANDQKILKYIHDNKTAALIIAACKGGAIAAKANKKTLEKFSIYASNIGLAFQVMDDILDVVSTTEKLGKKANKDEEQGKYTYPRIFGLEASKIEAKKLIKGACEAIADIPNNSNLIELAAFIISRDH